MQASQNFRTFVEDSLEASADEILWDKDSVLINGKMQKGDEFEIPAVHLNYIRAWFKALDEENRENNRQIPKTIRNWLRLSRNIMTDRLPCMVKGCSYPDG